MATVNYLYRSTRQEAPLNLRLLFAHKGKNYVIGGKTQKTVTKEYWNTDHTKKRINDIDRSNYQSDVIKHNNELRSHILKAFNKEPDPALINKDWLKKTIQDYYTPAKETPQAPKYLTDFFAFYEEIKQKDLSEARIKKLNVVKNTLLRFEAEKGKKVLISNVNDLFKKSFIEYCEAEQYGRNTIKTNLSVIKTVCTYASQWNIKTSPQLKNLRIKGEPVKSPYLSFTELKQISNKDFLKGGYLDNARDWLIISCYTGQRISDFLRFTPEIVIKNKGKYFLEFTQQKTGKLVTIPFLKEAKAIYDKHGGNFPRSLSAVKYNKYIKEVCEACEINKPTKGKVQICIADDPAKAKRSDYRRVLKTVPKYKLVSSHIGRRSFATNFYGKVPTSYLIQVTGHQTEKMFLKYIHKTEKETAFEAFKYFEQ